MPLTIPSRIESEGHFFALSDLELEETGGGGSFTIAGFAPKDLYRDWTLISGDDIKSGRIFITSTSQLPRLPDGNIQSYPRASCHFLWHIERARIL